MEYEKRKKFIVNFLYGAIVLLMVYAVIQYGLKFVTPFVFAFLIAYLLRGPSRFLTKKWRIPYKLSAILLVVVFYSTIGILLCLLGIKLVTSAIELVSHLPAIYTIHMEPFLRSFFGEIEQAAFQMDPALMDGLNELFTQFTQSLGKLVSDLSVKAVGTVSSYASSLPGLFIKILLMIISTFFIASDFDKLTGFVLRQFSSKGRELLQQIKAYIVGTLFVCIRSYLLIISITFMELSVGLSLLGISNAIPIAFFIAVFDILPVLGTGGIMIPWAVITLLQGEYTLALGLGIVYLVITVIRNIIEPKIVGSQIGLHPVVTLVSMFVGAQLFGILGLFGFPITLSLLRHLNDTGTIKIFR